MRRRRWQIKHILYVLFIMIIIYWITNDFLLINESNTNSIIYNDKIDIILSNTNNKRNLTIFTLIGVEGTGHHLWEKIMLKISKITNMDKTSNLKIITGRKPRFLHFKDCHDLSIEDMNKLINFTLSNEYHNDNLLYFVTPQLSYPCGINFKMPNLPKLMYLYENVLSKSENISNIYNIYLRYIVIKRNWIETIVSGCIHRFGQCEIRIYKLYNSYLLINKHIKHMIKYKYWIMLKYNHFLLNSKKYIDILSKWLNINNKTLIEHGLSVIKIKNNISDKSLYSLAWNKIEKWDNGEFIKPVEKHWRLSEHNKDLYIKHNLSFSLKNEILSLFYNLEMNQSIWNDDCLIVTSDCYTNYSSQQLTFLGG